MDKFLFLMFLINYNFIFSLFLVVFSIVALNFNSLFFTWVFIELNLLIVTPLLLIKSNFIKEQASLVLKYFLIQVIGSIFILISLTILKNNYFSIGKINLIVMLTLIIKSGTPPLHFWLPQVIYLSSPFQRFLILCPQKIIPFFIMSLIISETLALFTVLAAILGRIIGFNQNSLIKIIAYSSIVHSGWIISGFLVKLSVSYFYFLIYTVIRFTIFYLINFSSIKFISEFTNFNYRLSYKVSLIFSILTLSGTPPFVGFFRKIFIIKSLIISNFYVIPLFLVIGSRLSFYFYLRLFIRTSLFNNITLKEKLTLHSPNLTYSLSLINLRLLPVTWLLN